MHRYDRRRNRATRFGQRGRDWQRHPGAGEARPRGCDLREDVSRLDMDKRNLADNILAVGDLIITLDPRMEGVRVPSWLRAQRETTLAFGYACVVPIPDMIVSESGVSGTLKFGTIQYLCCVPWTAVLAMWSGDRMFGFDWRKPREKTGTRTRRKAPAVPYLRLVK